MTSWEFSTEFTSYSCQWGSVISSFHWKKSLLFISWKFGFLLESSHRNILSNNLLSLSHPARSKIGFWFWEMWNVVGCIITVVTSAVREGLRNTDCDCLCPHLENIHCSLPPPRWHNLSGRTLRFNKMIFIFSLIHFKSCWSGYWLRPGVLVFTIDCADVESCTLPNRNKKVYVDHLLTFIATRQDCFVTELHGE